ncbi:unnamed protein product [Toxocara canis]|uniref:G_PROTEIN_RECEP_F1_2 domain-containing protein n=1 Tax=Toxocara canis TaxID=6265 RepID=A0A183UHY4_TOXCA|nr:unnamed protein product [Toxocara canis]
MAGITVSAFVLTFIRRVDSFKNAFVKFNISQSIGDVVVLTVFAVHAAPMTYFPDTKFLKISLLNQLLGQFCAIAYVACIYTHLMIALNRFTAIAFPLKNRLIFTPRNSNLILLAVWMLSALQAIIYSFH